MSGGQYLDKVYLNEHGPLIPKRKSPVNGVLLLLTILFALASVALAVVLAVTVLKGDSDDDKTGLPRQLWAQKNQQPSSVNQQSPNQKPNRKESARASTSPSPTEPPKAEDICLTPGCVLAAARVQSRIDSSVNPCDDFFNFACGSWVADHVIPEDRGLLNTMDEVADTVSVKLKELFEEEKKASEPIAAHKAKDYYKECMDTDAVEDLGNDAMLVHMITFGGWPILGAHKGGNWDEESYNFEDLMLKTMFYKGGPLIDSLVGQDALNPEKNVLMMEQSSLGMPNRDYYLKNRNDTTLMTYEKFITDIAVAFGADESTAKKDSKDVVDLEIDLAKITVRVEDMRNPLQLYNKMTVGGLSDNFTGIDWMKLIQGTFMLVNMTVDEDEPLIVTTPEYFEKLETTLKVHGPRAVTNYVIWRITMAHLFYFPTKFTDIQMEYNKVLVGTASRPPRWQSCGDNAVGLMQQVAGRLFVEAYFSDASREDVLTMVDNLRSSLKEMITDLDWMGETTKSLAKEKADTLEPRIGYPDWIYDDDRLNERFEEVTVYSNELLRTYISFGVASDKYNLRQLRKTHDKSLWVMSPAEVNAYYDPGTNQITFPAGILQSPFYNKDQPQYLNYGAIGDVIGHEMTHGFDDQGRLYDKDGNLDDWWTPADEKKFKERAQCIIDQYSSYVVPGTGNMTLNGINTQGENIADNGGIKESFKAYRKWVSSNGKEEPKLPGLSYTSNQLYFLNAAQVWCSKYRNQEKLRRIRTDPHSLAMYRVYGPMQNFDEFSKEFSCPVGSFMNPKHKCAVW